VFAERQSDNCALISNALVLGNGPRKTLSGVDVTIAIFCDFRQISEKKLAFFSETNVLIEILQKRVAF
jgi:hypothetical protein